jgi:hypothetical protein
MPDDSPRLTRPRSCGDGNWQASYVATDGPPKRLVLVIEHETADGESIVGIPLTSRRARSLIQLLQDMLAEVGEVTGEPRAVDAANRGAGTHVVIGGRAAWVSLKTKKAK